MLFGYTLPTIWACSGLAPVRARPWRANTKKSLYAQYRLAREEMREYQKALHNTEVFFDMDRNSEIDYHLKEEFTKAQTQK